MRRQAAADVTVRAATRTDAPALADNTLAMALESEGITLDPATVRRGTDELLCDPGKGRLFVAVDGQGGVVGSTYVTMEWSDWHAAWYWWLQSVYVVPRRRGQGVYTTLYRAVQQAAREAGDVRSVRLYVEGHNEAGLRAYRGHGMALTPYQVFEWVVDRAPGRDAAQGKARGKGIGEGEAKGNGKGIGKGRGKGKGVKGTGRRSAAASSSGGGRTRMRR